MLKVKQVSLFENKATIDYIDYLKKANNYYLTSVVLICVHHSRLLLPL